MEFSEIRAKVKSSLFSQPCGVMAAQVVLVHLVQVRVLTGLPVSLPPAEAERRSEGTEPFPAPRTLASSPRIILFETVEPAFFAHTGEGNLKILIFLM